MALTAAQLEAYWKENPDQLTKAFESNPDAFRTQSLGSPEGNPGYSFGSQMYEPQHVSWDANGKMVVTGGEKIANTSGVSWVGPEGGDTQENRDQFAGWLGDVSIVDPAKISYNTPVEPQSGTQGYLAPTPAPEQGLLGPPPEQGGLLGTQNKNQGGLTDAQLQAWIDQSPENAATFGTAYTNQENAKWDAWLQESPSNQKAFAKSLLDQNRAGELSPEQTIELFKFAPTWEGYGKTGRAEIANRFYDVISENPDYYNTLDPQTQMQYVWLQYYNGEISGNQKDDRIKKIRKEAGLPKEQFEGESRFITRNKPTKDQKKDGLDPSDVYNIGTYTQSDTGKDDGMLEQFINKSLPGFDLTDVMEKGGVPLAVAAAIFSPYTMGATGAAYNIAAAANGRQGWDEAFANTALSASANAGNWVSSFTGVVTPLVGQMGVVTVANLINGEDPLDAVGQGLLSGGLSLGRNVLELVGGPYEYGPQDIAEIYNDAMPQNIANVLGEMTYDVLESGGELLDAVKGNVGQIDNVITNVLDEVGQKLEDFDQYLMGYGVGNEVPPEVTSVYQTLKGTIATLESLGDNIPPEIKAAITEGTIELLQGVSDVINYTPDVPTQTSTGAPLSQGQFSSNAFNFLKGDWEFMEDLPYKPGNPTKFPAFTGPGREGTTANEPTTPIDVNIPPIDSAPNTTPPPVDTPNIVVPPFTIPDFIPTNEIFTGEPPVPPDTGGEPPPPPEDIYDGEPPIDPTDPVDPWTPPPPVDTKEGDGIKGRSFLYDQDMSTRYVQPQYGPVTQRPLFEANRGGLVAPMVLPAANAGQDTWEQWLEKYFARGGDERGLLNMIAGSQPLGSGLI